MSGISPANLTDESREGGREYASVFSTSVKFLISVRGRWSRAQQSVNAWAESPVFLAARSHLESPIRLMLADLDRGRKPRGSPSRQEESSLHITSLKASLEPLCSYYCSHRAHMINRIIPEIRLLKKASMNIQYK